MLEQVLGRLNPEQLRAATSPAPIILCLAGAGSGKTATLTARIGHLQLNERVGTSNMVALTFTRAAAAEMKERVGRLIGDSLTSKLTCSTFHAFCVHVLRTWAEPARLRVDSSFSIYDEGDVKAIVDQIVSELRYTTLSRERLMEAIRGEREPDPGPEERVVREYGWRLQANNAVTLDGLLTGALHILREHPPALEEYRRRYSHVFVDEFQDTDDKQVELLKLLDPPHLFVVGDDFQAIYEWRSAKPEYIVRFADSWPGCEIVRLERNYRSTKPIVEAANQLIAHNKERTEKRLWTDVDGPLVQLHEAAPGGEGHVVATIVKARSDGRAPRDFAILARTNAHAGEIAEVLEGAGIPTHLVSPRRDVWNQRDIRGIVAGIEAAYNRMDGFNIRRLLATPEPRIPQAALERLELAALETEEPLWQQLGKVADKYPGLKSVLHGLAEMRVLIQEQVVTAEDAFRLAAEHLGFTGYYDRAGLTNRFEAYHRALRSVRRWQDVQAQLGEPPDPLAFVRWLRYRDIQDRLHDTDQDAVKIMTVHGAKGLEWPVVIVAGLNQGQFPITRSDSNLEEERRLMYVAATRARDELHITRVTAQPAGYGKQQQLAATIPSQFLAEMGLVPVTGGAVPT